MPAGLKNFITRVAEHSADNTELRKNEELSVLLSIAESLEKDTYYFEQDLNIEFIRCGTSDDAISSAENLNTDAQEKLINIIESCLEAHNSRLNKKGLTNTSIEDSCDLLNEELSAALSKWIEARRREFLKARNNFLEGLLDKDVYEVSLFEIKNAIEIAEACINDLILQRQLALNEETIFDNTEDNLLLSSALEDFKPIRANQKTLKQQIKQFTHPDKLMRFFPENDSTQNDAPSSPETNEQDTQNATTPQHRHEEFRAYLDNHIHHQTSAVLTDIKYYFANLLPNFVLANFKGLFFKTILNNVLIRFYDLDRHNEIKEIFDAAYVKAKITEKDKKNEIFLRNEIFFQLLLGYFSKLEKEKGNLEDLAEELNLLAYSMGFNCALLRHPQTQKHTLVHAGVLSTKQYSRWYQLLNFAMKGLVIIAAAAVAIGILGLVFSQTYALLTGYLVAAATAITLALGLALISSLVNYNLFKSSLEKGIDPFLNGDIEPKMTLSNRLTYYLLTALGIGASLTYGVITFISLQQMALTLIPLLGLTSVAALPVWGIAIIAAVTVVTAIATFALYFRSIKSMVKEDILGDFAKYCWKVYWYSFKETWIKKEYIKFFGCIVRALLMPVVGFVLALLGGAAAWAAFTVSQETSTDILTKLPLAIKGTITAISNVCSTVYCSIETVFNADLVLKSIQDITAIPVHIITFPINVISYSFNTMISNIKTIASEGFAAWGAKKWLQISEFFNTLLNFLIQLKNDIADNRRVLLRPFFFLSSLKDLILVVINATGNGAAFSEFKSPLSHTVNQLIGAGANFSESLLANKDEVGNIIPENTTVLNDLLTKEVNEKAIIAETLALLNSKLSGQTEKENPTKKHNAKPIQKPHSEHEFSEEKGEQKSTQVDLPKKQIQQPLIDLLINRGLFNKAPVATEMQTMPNPKVFN